MRGGKGATLGAVVAMLMAGCLSSTSAPSPTALTLPPLPEVPGLPIVQDHEHNDRALHQGHYATSYVAGVSGYDGDAPAGVGFTELDVKDGFAYVCRGGVVGALGPLAVTTGGFIIADVHDPLKPANLGAFDGVGCSDIKVNDAGDLVFYGTQRNPLYEALTNPAGPGANLPRGVYLINVADKAAPRLERYVPIPLNGVHTLHYANVDGRELLFVQTYDWIPDGGLGLPVPSTGLNNPATQRVNIFEVVRGADGDRDLRLLTVFLLPDPAAPGTNYFPHDVTVQRHPLTGAWLAYVAYWDQGLAIVDISQPESPRLLSTFSDTSPSAFVHTHQARPFPQLIAGKHVTVLEPELQAAPESGQFTLVDTTDPSAPKRLGYWTLPGDIAIPGGFLFSPHNFNLANGRIYLAHNHAGVWVVDASTAERLEQPVAVGYFQATEAGREDCSTTGRFWSAFYVQGYVYGSDECAGLVILQFDGDKGLEGQGPARVMPAQ
jgi:LVIVD repeat-containing protein